MGLMMCDGKFVSRDEVALVLALIGITLVLFKKIA